MRKQLISCCLTAAALLSSSCSTGYKITGFERSRILIDSTYDDAADKAVADFMKPYKRHVDSIMSPVVGLSAEYMYADRPESNLSNLLTDILVSPSTTLAACARPSPKAR